MRQRIMPIGALPMGSSLQAFDAMLKADHEAAARLVMQVRLNVD